MTNDEGRIVLIFKDDVSALRLLITINPFEKQRHETSLTWCLKVHKLISGEQ